MANIPLLLCFLILAASGPANIVSATKEKVGTFELKKGDITLNLTNWGASIISLVLPDKHGLFFFTIASLCELLHFFFRRNSRVFLFLLLFYFFLLSCCLVLCWIFLILFIYWWWHGSIIFGWVFRESGWCGSWVRFNRGIQGLWWIITDHTSSFWFLHSIFFIWYLLDLFCIMIYIERLNLTDKFFNFNTMLNCYYFKKFKLIQNK